MEVKEGGTNPNEVEFQGDDGNNNDSVNVARNGKGGSDHKRSNDASIEADDEIGAARCEIINITVSVASENEEEEEKQDENATEPITRREDETENAVAANREENDRGEENTIFQVDDDEQEDGKKLSISDSSSDISDATVVSSITFHNVGYEVQQRRWCKRLLDKTILHSVSGEMNTGINAIMGPTGSGKTTLLDLLADRKDKSGKSGKILINGHKRQPNYKTAVGYVVQDDLVMGTLSVRENLEFSAALRLPGHMTRAQRNERVERIIETLGLYRCADTKVGTQFYRGVSGGERKRINIGMELIIEPRVLFLDEPTTGLDANTAVSIISLLKQMSVNEKRLIVLSIHQPRYSIFKLFDSLTLLSHGSVVYHGPTNSALSYFDRLGFRCEDHNNPADFVLDTIISCETQLRMKSEATIITMSTTDEEIVFSDRSANTATAGGDKSIQLAERYQESDEYRELRKKIDPILQNMVDEKKETMARQSCNKVFSSNVYATSFPWQYLMVTWRSTRNLLRNPQFFVYQFFYSIIVSVFTGLVYWQLDTEPNNFNDRIGALAFLTGERAYTAVVTIQIFIQHKALFIHENASGYYRVSVFFLAKITTDLLLLRFIPNVIYAIVVYFTIGFQVDAENFFIFWFILILVQLSAVSLALFISAWINSSEVATHFFLLPFIFSLLFGGIFVTFNSIAVWISWMKYISFLKYAVEALLIIEMDGLVFQGPCEIQQVTQDVNSTLFTSPFNENFTSECVFEGLTQLGQLGFGNTTTIVWWDVFALVIYSSFFLTLTYITLRLIKKEK